MEKLDELLGKFDNIGIEESLDLSPEDLEFCKAEQDKYLKGVARTTDILTELENLLEKYPPNCEGLHKIEVPRHSRKSSGYWKVEEDWNTKQTERKEGNLYNLAEYSILYPIARAKKAIWIMETTFVGRLNDYFKEKYNLDISADENMFRDEDGNIIGQVGYKAVVSELVNQSNGVSFSKMGEENVKIAFKNLVYKPDKLSVVKDKVIFDAPKYFEKHWRNSTYSVGSWGRDKILSMSKALALFDGNGRGSTELLDHLVTIDDVLFNTWYDFNDTSRISSIKFFKNGKIEFKFSTEQEPQQFLKFFDLN